MMRKNWFVGIIALVFILVLSACSGSSEDDSAEPEDVKGKDSQIEEKEQKETESSDDESEEEEASEEDEETDDSAEESDDNDEETDDSAGESDDNDEETDDSDKESDDNDEATDSDEEDFSYDTLIELGFDIFEAQVEEDYDFLESVLSEGSSVNKDDNTLQFDNVTYPHEYEFISKEDYQVLSERYINGDEKEGVTVGYDITDFETESSYVIDTEFIKEDGKWKINDIDVNK